MKNVFFEKYWTYLAEDIQHKIRCSLHDFSDIVPPGELKNMLLDELSVVFAKNGCNILDHGLPPRTVSDTATRENNMLSDERSQDFETLIKTSEAMQQKLNRDQEIAFRSIIDRVREEKPGFFGNLCCLAVIVRHVNLNPVDSSVWFLLYNLF
jgi:hypothetical protein